MLSAYGHRQITSELLLMYYNYIIRDPEKQGGHFLFFNLHMASDTLLLNCGSLITELPEYLDTSISTDPSSSDPTQS